MKDRLAFGGFILLAILMASGVTWSFVKMHHDGMLCQQQGGTYIATGSQAGACFRSDAVIKLK